MRFWDHFSNVEDNLVQRVRRAVEVRLRSRRSARLGIVLTAGSLCLLAASCAPPPPPTRAFDGTYRGAAFAENDPGGLCSQTVGAQPMTVTDGHVVFGQFIGGVQSNGYLQLVVGSFAGGTWLEGSFQDGRFQGGIRNPQPGCNYRLELTREAG